MTFDIFFSICQTPVDGYKPNEQKMFTNFFDQVELADRLGYKTAWVAETHLSCQIQKQNPGAVISHFEGEIGLNTDILQLAHVIMSRTKNINVGSAIRNILCNGGPIAHAEAVKTFLTLQSLMPYKNRLLELGFAAGRFPFSNLPYGIKPRNSIEESCWPALQGKVFLEATEIFLRFLRGDIFSSNDVQVKTLKRSDFRSDEDFEKLKLAWTEANCTALDSAPEEFEFESFWKFPIVGVIPFEAPLKQLKLTIGAHWAEAHQVANKFLPTGVFNLSITPTAQIEETHQRMTSVFHADGGQWSRYHMPRTVLVFINDEDVSLNEKRTRAKALATHALENYWRALEGTLDPSKVENAVQNSLVGSPEDIIEQMKTRFHQDDRLMLWFDFNDHNNERVKTAMSVFAEKVRPHFQS